MTDPLERLHIKGSEVIFDNKQDKKLLRSTCPSCNAIGNTSSALGQCTIYETPKTKGKVIFLSIMLEIYTDMHNIISYVFTTIFYNMHNLSNYAFV